MRLKIIGKPTNKYLIGHSNCIKVTDADTGKEIEGIKSIQIDARVGNIVTAKLEFYVEELDLDGVKADED